MSNSSYDINDINNLFTYHAFHGPEAALQELLRENAKLLAQLILENCPDSRERSLALTNLRLTIFWANDSIARRDLHPEGDASNNTDGGVVPGEIT